ncbi:hypothetical protein AT246_00300 [Bartonella henselae]|nr:hypothetical protein AT241_02625 [Bartonella henselae]OLL48682.1 hypothetical protein AT247_00845 [Bartonella henselae]OLL49777.1 hypothetical protein AT243_01140 [Bartonella henselae]OLL57329.1 hypothetical protein AT246_00300 [Bartonella henselae]
MAVSVFHCIKSRTLYKIDSFFAQNTQNKYINFDNETPNLLIYNFPIFTHKAKYLYMERFLCPIQKIFKKMDIKNIIHKIFAPYKT